jgi:hypothetical protein
MTLEDLLNRTIDLLQHPEFKSFGALQKHRYQMEKWENPEDVELLRDLYKGTKMTPEQIKKQVEVTKKKRKEKSKNNRLDKYTKRITEIKRQQSLALYRQKLKDFKNSMK